MRARDVRHYTLFFLLLAVLAAFLLWPIVSTVTGGFLDTRGHFTLRFVVSVFHDPVWMGGLYNSLLIATFTTGLALLIALPLSVLGARYEFRGKAILASLLLVPLILPPFVGAIGLRAILGRYGALNAILFPGNRPGIDFLGGRFIGGRFAAIVLMEALHLYPILYLNVTAALANLDPALDEAAQNLGAGAWRRFFRVTLPLILPGVFAGVTIVFIWSFTELGTPLMFDYYQVTPVQVFWGLQEISTNPRVYALVVVMLAAAAGLYLLGRLAIGGRGYAMQAKASVATTERRLTGLRAAAAMAAFLSVTFLAVLPHLGVILSAFTVDGAWYHTILPSRWTLQHFKGALTQQLAVTSIRNSLIYASTAMAVCLAAGLAISWLTVRARVRGGWLLDTLAMLPLAVPGLVMAFGYVAMSLSWPIRPLGDWLEAHGWVVLASLCRLTGSAPDPLVFLVIAYAVRRLPYTVRSATAGLEQTSVTLEEAARNLGASALTTLRRITVPLIAANLIAGGILAFSFAMLEVSDSLILAQRESDFPITRAIYELFNRLGDGPYIASAMGVWGMILLSLTLITAGLLMGRKMGALFRV